MMKKFMITIGFIFLCIYAFHLFSSSVCNTSQAYYEYDDSKDTLKQEAASLELDNTPIFEASKKHSNSVPASNKIKLDLNPSSITFFVNKEYGLSSDYVPEELVVPDILFNINYFHEKKLMKKEAADAIECLFQAATEDNITLYAVSGYRSYKRQSEIYQHNLATKGEEHTSQFSAKPGYSEHQTGLSMDVSASCINCRLDDVFAGTAEGKWLAQNAHRFGFIIRYPEDKTDITGYAYEPWHIRYVGKKLATHLYKKDYTLEEYYNYTPNSNFVKEQTQDRVIDTAEREEE